LAEIARVDPSFQVVLESCTRAQEAYAAASTAEGNAPNPSLFAQVEQLLGEDSEPDVKFFIDSWTVGVAAASENFLRRHQDQKIQQKSREHAVPAFNTICSFPPFFTIEESPRNPEASLETEFLAENAEPSAPTAFPLTLEAATGILGIAPTSTREQIKIAYRKMASRYHPDRLDHATSHEHQLATDRMAAINEAYRLLSRENCAQPS
jgi:DnaJ-domain-containing protein 1